MGHCGFEEIENKARGKVLLDSRCLLTEGVQAITIIPRKNRLRIYVDGDDKYYRLREMKRGLAEVVVKVSWIFFGSFIIVGSAVFTGCLYHSSGSY